MAEISSTAPGVRSESPLPYGVIAALENFDPPDSKATEIAVLKQAERFLRAARSSFDTEDGTIRNSAGPQDVREVVETAIALINSVSRIGKAPMRLFDVIGALLIVSTILESDLDIDGRGIVASPVLGALDLAAYSLFDVAEEYEEREAAQG